MNFKLMEEKKCASRRTGALVLIMHHLSSIGMLHTAQTLEKECNLSRFHKADNIDLMLILKEFEVYYEIKYGKFPILYRQDSKVLLEPIKQVNEEKKPMEIIGLDDAKKIIEESLVYPTKYPALFKDLNPWRAMLLYGPPGTGKTSLARSVAVMANTTFFNVTASTIASKWRGESEKLVRKLFEQARLQKPSTIFIDEVESVLGSRKQSDHEASKRTKAEFLQQMDNLDGIFVIAASNFPWDIDDAVLRRLEKRVFVGLPDLNSRQKMLKLFLMDQKRDENGTLFVDEFDYEMVSGLLEGYSGADIKLVAQETLMVPVREAISSNSNRRPANTNDALSAIKTTKPANSQSKKYKLWIHNNT